jgi:sporulation protein YlmC with PRC-barrel domain
MHSPARSRFIMAITAASLMSSAASAQTAQPNAGPSDTSVTSTTTTLTTTKWMTEEKADQSRTTKLIGLNVYNSNNEKIGDIAELIVDRSGKLEAVVVGAGGFLGVGERDVAVPYSQINWAYQPVASSSAGTAPITTTGAEKSASQSPENARFNPDHAVLNMTKDELKAAPAFTFSR